MGWLTFPMRPKVKVVCDHEEVNIGGQFVPEECGSIYLFERCKDCGETLRRVSLTAAIDAVPYKIIDRLFKAAMR